jgi:hypothetical protein
MRIETMLGRLLHVSASKSGSSVCHSRIRYILLSFGGFDVKTHKSTLDDRGGPPLPRRRRDRDDRQHDAIIEDRINRERPCRTLFVRNIKASCAS